jgi:hypothetical protein
LSYPSDDALKLVIEQQPICLVFFFCYHPLIKKITKMLNKGNNHLSKTSYLKASEAWKSLMKRPPAAPLCPGHREPAELKTVKKKGPNCGRQFYACARGEGKVYFFMKATPKPRPFYVF